MNVSLKKYIMHIKTLEEQRFVLTNTINKIDSTINSLCVPKKIYREYYRNDKNYFDDNKFEFGCSLFFLILTIVFFKAWNATGINGKYSFSMGLLSIICTILTVWPIGSVIYNKIKGDRYAEAAQKELDDKYQKDLLYENNRIQKEKLMKSNYQKARNEMYQVYCTVCNTLSALYNKNIIYEKYRGDLVAICMFLEYLKSGRCDQLKGHEGAYNIYENEIRLGIIISKLDEVIEKLDEISNNQYMLYSTMQKIEQKQNHIINNLKYLSNSTNQMNKNLEYIKYNSEVIRKNSDIATLYMLY